MFLYDVTSTYLEGEQNAFAAFGYNRDRKSGKRQIVIGLLSTPTDARCRSRCSPAIPRTSRRSPRKLRKAAARFGAERVTFVGDRGMIKAPQRAELGAADFHYITAITKAQIDGLIAAGVLQMDLFEETLAEVEGRGWRALRAAAQSGPRRGIGGLPAGQADDAANRRASGRQISERASRGRRRRHKWPG